MSTLINQNPLICNKMKNIFFYYYRVNLMLFLEKNYNLSSRKMTTIFYITFCFCTCNNYRWSKRAFLNFLKFIFSNFIFFFCTQNDLTESKNIRINHRNVTLSFYVFLSSLEKRKILHRPSVKNKQIIIRVDGTYA